MEGRKLFNCPYVHPSIPLSICLSVKCSLVNVWSWRIVTLTDRYQLFHLHRSKRLTAHHSPSTLGEGAPGHWRVGDGGGDVLAVHVVSAHSILSKGGRKKDVFLWPLKSSVNQYVPLLAEHMYDAPGGKWMRFYIGLKEKTTYRNVLLAPPDGSNNPTLSKDLFEFAGRPPTSTVLHPGGQSLLAGGGSTVKHEGGKKRREGQFIQLKVQLSLCFM